VATPSPREHAVPDDTAERRWRERLLPFMARMLLALSAFFLVASLIQLTYLQSRIWNAPKGNLASVEQLLAAQPADPVADRLAVFRAGGRSGSRRSRWSGGTTRPTFSSWPGSGCATWVS
jgi:hypothetical protein